MHNSVSKAVIREARRLKRAKAKGRRTRGAERKVKAASKQAEA